MDYRYSQSSSMIVTVEEPVTMVTRGGSDTPVALRRIVSGNSTIRSSMMPTSTHCVLATDVKVSS